MSLIEPGAMDTDFFKTLSKNSDERMRNSKSPYSNLYKNDLSYRKKQKRADAEKAAEEIYNIIKKKKMKACYKIVLPIVYSVLIALPDGVREKLMICFNR